MILARRAPWHLWVVGVLAILWNLGGVMDYTLTQTGNAAYMDQFTTEHLAYFASWPAWFEGFWALGVWGAFAGSVLLLFRSRFACHAYIVSLVGILGTSFWTITSPMPKSMNSPGLWAFNALIILSVILLAYYSRRMTAAGVLR